MYFFIPFGIFVLSIVAIAVIIGRKFVYLKKLTPETLEPTSAGVGFWEEMFPEILTHLKKIKIRQYGVNVLSEIEKTLRKLRLVSMKVDTLTNQLINKVRKSTKQQEAIIKEKNNGENAKPQIANSLEIENGSKEELKQKEQNLIIEIAKNPKDAQLYKELGSIYMRTGELEDAKQSFEKVLDFEPNDEATKKKLGRVLTKLKEKNKDNMPT